MLLQTPQRQPFRTEGIDLNNPYTLRRNDLCNIIMANLRVNNIVFIKGPPSIGKTSIARLLVEYVCSHDEFDVVHSVSFLKMDDGQTPSGFLQAKGIPDFNRDDNIGQMTLVIIDEVHRGYSFKTDAIWRNLKSLLGTDASSSHLKIVLIGTHSKLLGIDSSPLELQEACAVTDLRYSRVEFDILITQYNTQQQKEHPTHVSPLISSNVASILWVYTDGHPGVTTSALSTIASHFEKEVHPSDAKLKSFILSYEFPSLLASRAFPSIGDPAQQQALIQALQRRLHSTDPSVPFLSMVGVIRPIPGDISFCEMAAPIFFHICVFILSPSFIFLCSFFTDLFLSFFPHKFRLENADVKARFASC